MSYSEMTSGGEISIPEGLKFREKRGGEACERAESVKGEAPGNQTKPSSSAGLHTSLWDEHPPAPRPPAPTVLHAGLACVSRAMKSALWLSLLGQGVFHAPHTGERPGQSSVQLSRSQPLCTGIMEHA